MNKKTILKLKSFLFYGGLGLIFYSVVLAWMVKDLSELAIHTLIVGIFCIWTVFRD